MLCSKRKNRRIEMQKQDLEIKIHSLTLLKEISRHILQFADYHQISYTIDELIKKHEEKLSNENKAANTN